MAPEEHAGSATALVKFHPRAEDPQEFFVGAPLCPGCNSVVDPAWLPTRFRVRKRHASLYTYDGAVLVNQRFVELVGAYPGVVFDAVPGDLEYGTVGATRICHQHPCYLLQHSLAGRLRKERLCHFSALRSA